MKKDEQRSLLVCALSVFGAKRVGGWIQLLDLLRLVAKENMVRRMARAMHANISPMQWVGTVVAGSLV